MKKYTVLKLLVIVIVTNLFSTNGFSQHDFERLPAWETVQQAVKENRITYLLNISTDTLSCVECNNGESLVPKVVFFSDYIHQLKQAQNKAYSFHVEKINDESAYSKYYRINYAEHFEGHPYNLIYMLKEGEKGIQFLGVFSVP